VTRAQRAVLGALEGATGFLSAQDVHARLRDGARPTGLTSVYRALALLAESGAVDTLRTTTGESTYRLCRSAGHHHHLTCQRCGATVELEARSVERWIDQVASAHGYRVEGHTVELTGHCPRCQRRRTATAAR